MRDGHETRVVNLRKEKYTIYIGRRDGTTPHWGNPFPIGPYCTRDESISRFRAWLRGDNAEYLEIEPSRRGWILDNIESLRGETLGCFCKPLDCHGDVYIEILSGRVS